MLEYRSQSMLLYELLRRRITVDDNISNSNSISSNHNDYSTGSVASVTAPTSEPVASKPVVASGASFKQSADAPELAQQATTTTTAAAATEISMQDRPLTTAVLVPSALSGESQSRT
eukprot:3415-Heterococcus_DN1.PRE.1